MRPGHDVAAGHAGPGSSVHPLVAALAEQERQQNQKGGNAAAALQPPVFPQRPGQPLCDLYAKTGHSKFGELCRFDHPAAYAVRLNALGLPLRPGEPVCAHFERNRLCRFGPACKFHHPEAVAPLPA